jgi:hypothetical protein
MGSIECCCNCYGRRVSLEAYRGDSHVHRRRRRHCHRYRGHSASASRHLVQHGRHAAAGAGTAAHRASVRCEARVDPSPGRQAGTAAHRASVRCEARIDPSPGRQGGQYRRACIPFAPKSNSNAPLFRGPPNRPIERHGSSVNPSASISEAETASWDNGRVSGVVVKPAQLSGADRRGPGESHHRDVQGGAQLRGISSLALSPEFAVDAVRSPPCSQSDSGELSRCPRVAAPIESLY